jgi:hypothetical protein
MQGQPGSIKLTYDTQHNEWKMAVGQGDPQGPGHYPGLSVPYNQTASFTFQIVAPPGVNFTTDGPFKAKPGGNGKSDFGDQFDVSAGGGRSLTVSDMNGQKLKKDYKGGDYHYELHFSNGTTLDPVITNGGCCQAAPTGYLTYLAIGVVALVAIWVLLVRPMMARNRPTDTDGV